MAQERNFSISKNLEQAVPIFNVHPSTIALGMLGMIVGIIADSFLLSIVGATALTYFLAKMREGTRRGAAKHFLYRAGILKQKNFVEIYKNRFYR